MGNSEGNTPSHLSEEEEGGGPEEGLVELEGGVLRGLMRDFLEEPPKAVPGETEASLFPLQSLEEGVPLGERGGGVPPPRFPD
ncbi:UNVERIFIED_CONTAM: hypothetical protein Sradi_3159400 [Sesamum radiatum]|uniref:Uncharacterized protein n=1 Tax=Sesamum radiatum TaxID=300843 RepID=A0AAW2REX3_SESRA